MLEIIFCRHGETEGNKKGILMGGLLDFPLTEKGILQAKKVGNLLKKSEFDKIFCSPNTRALDTLKLSIGTEVEFKVDERLREVSYGEMTGKMVAEIPAEIDAMYWKDPYGFAHKDGESIEELVGRVGGFIEELGRHQNEVVLVFAHCNVIRAAIAYMKGLDRECVALKIDNGKLTKYIYDGQRYECAYINKGVA